MKVPSSFLLQVSAKHLRLARKTHSLRKVPGTGQIENAIVSIIFSAAALEASVNKALSVPVLLVKERAPRLYFGTLLSRYAKLPIPGKLSFLSEIFPSLKLRAGDRKKVQELFRLRNDILHASPNYAEAIDAEPILKYMRKNKLTSYNSNDRFLPTKGHLFYTVEVSSVVDTAEGAHHTAKELIARLGTIDYDEIERAFLKRRNEELGI